MQTLKNHPYIPSGVKENIPSGVKEYIPSGVKKVFGFKKGGKTTTLHSITKSSKKSNW
jgi:adenylate cyclase